MLSDLILLAELHGCFCVAHAREGHRHEEEVALVDARQEFAAKTRQERQTGRNGQRGRRQSEGRTRERKVHERPVDSNERTGEWVRELGPHASLQKLGAQRGSDRERHDGGHRDDQRLAECQRPEQPPGLAGKGEDGQETERRDDERDQDRRDEGARGGDQRSTPVCRRGVRGKGLEAPMACFERHDVRIDGEAEGDSDAPEAHDGGGNVQDAHPQEGQEDDERQRQKRNESALLVPEEDQDDEPHDSDFLAQRAEKRVLDASGEIESVVYRDQLDVPRQLRSELPELLLRGFDDRSRVRSSAGDDDAADRGGRSAVVHDPERHVGRDRHAGHVADVRFRGLAVRAWKRRLLEARVFSVAVGRRR